MDRILDLQISYPDFQLNQIIDPEQVDLNNAQVVGKVNAIIRNLNTMSFGEGSNGGAVHIKIKPLVAPYTASNVQTALEELAKINNEQAGIINQIIAMNTEQNTRLGDVETKNTQQDTRLATLEGTTATHGTRISAVENKANANESSITRLASRATALEQTDTSHNERITVAETKNNEQDRNIVALQVVDDTLSRRMTSAESTNSQQGTDIARIKSDINAINQSNTNAEVISARTSGTTGTRYDTIGKRMDDLQVGVGTQLSTGQRGKLNMILTSSDDPVFWEDGIQLGNLKDHNDSPDSHALLVANHEIDPTSHADIRSAIANIDPTADWNKMVNKPATFPPATHQHGKADIRDFEHGHPASQITGLPTSLPANGGNADTVDGKHASDFALTTHNALSYRDARGEGNKQPTWYAGKTRTTELITGSEVGAWDWGLCTLTTTSAWHDTSGGVTQLLQNCGSNVIAYRSAIGNSWTTWYNPNAEIDSLKSSVVDGKRMVANAINGKAGSSLNENHTFNDYTWQINQLRVPKLIYSETGTGESRYSDSIAYFRYDFTPTFLGALNNSNKNGFLRFTCMPGYTLGARDLELFGYEGSNRTYIAGNDGRYDNQPFVFDVGYACQTHNIYRTKYTSFAFGFETPYSNNENFRMSLKVEYFEV